MISKTFLLWIIPKKNSPKYLTKEEFVSAKELSNPKKNKFFHSRSFIREVLSELLDINPLNVPLDGAFGKIPFIPPEFGYLSISHCENALLIGWSTEKIGVDIERKNRNFDANKIMKRFSEYKRSQRINKSCFWSKRNTDCWFILNSYS